jgi:hypothetical protein
MANNREDAKTLSDADYPQDDVMQDGDFELHQKRHIFNLEIHA